MYSFFEPLFWVYFLYFVFAVTLAFFIPGNLFLRRLKLDPLSEIVLSLIVGFVFWCLQGFLFGYLQLRWLSFVYLVISLVGWLSLYRTQFLNKIKFKRPDYIILGLIITGTLIQLFSVWPNGLVVNKGLYFCCGLPDTVYHLALTSELVNNFPPHEPGVSGVLLQNYHYLSNLGVADLARVFQLPLISTQYQYMTILLSLLLGLSVLVLANLLNLSRTVKLWLLFFLFFYGDIIFLLSYFNGKGINFLYTTLENAQSLWISPPRFYAIVVFFAGLSLFTLWIKRRDFLTGVVMALVFASLIGMKIYVGAIMLAGLGVLGVVYLIKREYRMLSPIIIFYLVAAALFVPINSHSGGMYFSGFWRFEDFIVQPSLGLVSLELARQIFAAHHNTLRVLLYDLYFGLLYFVFSAGVLVLGLLQTKKSLKQVPGYFTLVLVVGLLATCSAGFFFLQKSGGANSGQFLISMYVVGVIYAALAVSWWLNKVPKSIRIILILLIITITSIRVLHDGSIRLTNILKTSGPSIDSQALDSFKYFTRTKVDDVVLVQGEVGWDCLLVKIVGHSSPFVCTSGAPGDRGLDLKERIAVKNKIFYGENLKEAQLALRENKISYLYLPKSEVAASNIGKLGLLKVYDNNREVIYKLNY